MPPNNNIGSNNNGFPKNNVEPKHHRQINSWMILTIAFILISIILAVLVIWLYVNYNEQKTNVESKIEIAVSAGKNKQRINDEAKFTEREKLPYIQFVGPDDYGRVSFYYPKTWSVYINKDASKGGTYEAYLNPVNVPTISASQQYAIRLIVEQKDFDKVVGSYDSLVKKGDLISSAVSINGSDGTRLDGHFTKDILGSAVIFKIRDKTLTIRTDASTFKPDYEILIKTIKFNQ